VLRHLIRFIRCDQADQRSISGFFPQVEIDPRSRTSLIAEPVRAMMTPETGLRIDLVKGVPMALRTSPATATATEPVTAEQLMEISQDDAHRYELMQGDLIVMSPAGGRHGQLAAQILVALATYADSRRAGVTYAAETGFRLTRDPDTVLAPDVSFITIAHLTPGRVTDAFIPGAPDLVVEVLSPSDTVGRTAVKVQTWLRHGAQLVWVVEPESATVTVHRADGTVSLLQTEDSLDGEQLLPGFSYPLVQLFR
jgi:Uma2 family endonuclease